MCPQHTAYLHSFGGSGRIRTYSPEGTDLQSAAALQLDRTPIIIAQSHALLSADSYGRYFRLVQVCSGQPLDFLSYCGMGNYLHLTFRRAQIRLISGGPDEFRSRCLHRDRMALSRLSYRSNVVWTRVQESNLLDVIRSHIAGIHQTRVILLVRDPRLELGFIRSRRMRLAAIFIPDKIGEGGKIRTYSDLLAMPHVYSVLISPRIAPSY